MKSQTEESFNKIQTKISETDKVLQEITKSMNAAMSELTEANEFSYVLLRATNDDKDALFKLVHYSQVNVSKFQRTAREAVDKIINKLYPTYRLVSPPRKIEWSEGVDPTKLKYNDILKTYLSTPILVRYDYARQLYKLEQLTKFEQLNFLYQIIKHDTSLEILVWACDLMNKEANLNKNVLGLQSYIDWWEKNKEHYQNRKVSQD